MKGYFSFNKTFVGSCEIDYVTKHNIEYWREPGELKSIGQYIPDDDLYEEDWELFHLVSNEDFENEEDVTCDLLKKSCLTLIELGEILGEGSHDFYALYISQPDLRLVPPDEITKNKNNCMALIVTRIEFIKIMDGYKKILITKELPPSMKGMIK